MATAQALREIEDECPWLREDFRAGLTALSDSTAEQARRFAADMRVLAELTARVPRCPMDERRGTPWTSFRRDVAVARRISDRAAAAEIRAAVALITRMPETLALLSQGRITVQRARAFLDELEGVDDGVALLVDEQLAEKVAKLSVARIKQETRRAILKADPDEAARRTADKNDNRDVVFLPETDDQATVLICGPAVPVARMFQTLDQRARALKAADDPRTLAQLRFDLAVTTFPCATHAPGDPTAGAAGEPRDDTGEVAAAAAVVGAAAAAAGLRPSFTEAADADCRMSRPVQAHVTVRVETALGLSNEPGWLDGYGWLSSPTCRLLLVDAELRRVCRPGPGQLVDVDQNDVRPPRTWIGLRHALMDMIVDDITLTGAAGRIEDRHDPSPGLRELAELRDRFDDGPTGSIKRERVRARPRHALAARPDRSLEPRRARDPHPPAQAPRLDTAAQPTSTFWFTPAGQVVEVPRHTQPPPGDDDDEQPVVLPDPEQFAATDLAQLQPFAVEDHRPWLTGLPADTAEWTWLDAGDAPPF